MKPIGLMKRIAGRDRFLGKMGTTKDNLKVLYKEESWDKAYSTRHKALSVDVDAWKYLGQDASLLAIYVRDLGKTYVAPAFAVDAAATSNLGEDMQIRVPLKDFRTYDGKKHALAYTSNLVFVGIHEDPNQMNLFA